MIDDHKRFVLYEDRDELNAITYTLYNGDRCVGEFLPDDEYVGHLRLSGVKVLHGINCFQLRKEG